MMNQPYTEQDALLRMTICGGEARVLLMRTTALSQKAGDLHNASDTAIAAMSRLMTGTAMLGVMMKEKDANESALEEKMDRWVYLNDLAERIEAQKQGGK